MHKCENEPTVTTHLFSGVSYTQLYVAPLRAAADTASKIISKKAIGTIFGNVEEIITISHVCLSPLSPGLTPSGARRTQQ